jgi:hypothetical protein
MNFFITFLFVFVMMFPGFNNSVHAFNNVILQVLLNNGNAMYCNGGDCCNTSEFDLISQKVYTMSGYQRHLRGNDIVDEGNAVIDVTNAFVVDDEARGLRTYAAYCANRCAGYAKGRCLALNCGGYRRSVMESVRELFWSTNCENQKSEVNNVLNNIVNNQQVSNNCKSYLMAPRQLTCYSNVAC